MSYNNIKYYIKYKRELQVAILENEDKELLQELLYHVNANAFKIHSLDDIIKDTKENYILHYQASRRIAVRKDSAIGEKLMKGTSII